MTMVGFEANGNAREGYLALPEGGRGQGVLVLHPWWGLTEEIKSLCDRLAADGLVAFAPDYYLGQRAHTIPEAEAMLEQRDGKAMGQTAVAGMRYLRALPGVDPAPLRAVGFSMGAGYALFLDETFPGTFDKIVLFYGGSEADLSTSKARFQCHFAEDDDWEPLEYVKKLTAPNVEIFTYPGVYHWFFESDRADHYNPQAAALAYQRTIAFLRE